ncbi:MAG: ADP-ribosylglycohydrolase family protein, partial [Planctomycetia bacterium]
MPQPSPRTTAFRGAAFAPAAAVLGAGAMRLRHVWLLVGLLVAATGPLAIAQTLPPPLPPGVTVPQPAGAIPVAPPAGFPLP